MSKQLVVIKRQTKHANSAQTLYSYKFLHSIWLGATPKTSKIGLIGKLLPNNSFLKSFKSLVPKVNQYY